MKDKSDLYLSVPFNEYKLGKSLVLHSHIELLNVMKSMEKLREIKREKNILKLRLHKTLGEIKNKIDKVEKDLPHLKITKPPTPQKPRAEPRFPKEEVIEKELIDVKEKLKELTSA